jgi:hypothetical protein
LGIVQGRGYVLDSSACERNDPSADPRRAAAHAYVYPSSYRDAHATAHKHTDVDADVDRDAYAHADGDDHANAHTGDTHCADGGDAL